MSWNAQTPSLVFFSPNPFSESIASPRQGVWHRAVGQTVLVSGESGAGKTETTKCPGESAKRDLAVCLKPSHWWPPFKQSKKAHPRKSKGCQPREMVAVFEHRCCRFVMRFLALAGAGGAEASMSTVERQAGKAP